MASILNDVILQFLSQQREITRHLLDICYII